MTAKVGVCANLCLLASVVCASGEMLVNNRFADSGLTPWVSITRHNQRQLHIVRDGHLTIVGDPENKNNNMITLTQALPGLTQNAHYRLSARVRCHIPKTENKQISVTVRQADAAGKTIEYTGVHFLPGVNAWTEQERVFTPFPQAASFTFYITTGNLDAEDLVEVSEVSLRPVEGKVNLFLVGDSTMCEYTALNAPREGWGMRLQPLCSPDVLVVNCAVSGRSTKSFQARGSWERVLAQLRPGDYVVIGMGINDNAPKATRPQNHTETGGEFEGNLKRWIGEVRSRNALPVLCTTTVLWQATGRKSPQTDLGKYNQAILEVARECGCPAIDLHAKAFPLIAAMEKPQYDSIYMSQNKDYCHLTDKGAEFYAKLFVSLSKEQPIPFAALFK